MGLILLEALLALVVLIAIVWWTMFSGRRRGELPRNPRMKKARRTSDRRASLVVPVLRRQGCAPATLAPIIYALGSLFTGKRPESFQ
ncbi:hypothetical protein ACFQOZ_09250 [Comamonas endophytica]|uniref:hypothetical protein n=1 Tax=Comamonas endophytica TaxID=2949090 RepID=UPI00360D635C